MTAATEVSVPPRWLHGLAILTVCATLPLLFLGAEVTTKGVGMVDPVGFRGPFDLLYRLFTDEQGNLGLFIEYNHRLAGMVVGICAILLVISLWLVEPRRSIRWLGVGVLALICIQGLLGKYRVDLDSLFHRNLAMVHGLFAEITIASLICLAVCLSRGWVLDRNDMTKLSPALRRFSLITVLLVFIQLILGSLIRHNDYEFGSRGAMIGPRGHMLGAFAVLAVVMILARLAKACEQHTSFDRAVKILHALVGLQILLGIEAWLSRFFPGTAPASAHSHYLRSAHYVVGAFIFAITVVVALKAYRREIWMPSLAKAPQLEVAR